MRKIILKIVIAIILIVLAIVAVKIWKDKTTSGNDPEGTITVILKDLNDREETRTIDFYEDDTFLGLLEKEYTISYKDSSYGAVLYNIDWIKTDFKTTYIAIYIDDKYSTVGVSSIELKDGMTILLLETKI